MADSIADAFRKRAAPSDMPIDPRLSAPVAAPRPMPSFKDRLLAILGGSTPPLQENRVPLLGGRG